MSEINRVISKWHADVEEIETTARHIEARICRIQGTSRYLPLRRYGSPVDGNEIRKNITLVTLINRHDPELASYLGFPSGQHRIDQEEREARALQAEALQRETERLRQRNAAAQQQREKAQSFGINPITNRRYGI